MSANVKEEKMDNSSTADWQDTLSNNKQRLEFVRSSKNFSDVTFIVGNEDDLKSIEAHRLILSMSSPVFAALFHGPLASGKREIRLPEEEPQVFEQMLDYIYTERPNLTVDSLVKLCASAKKFALIHLENDCLKYLKKHLKTDNVLNIYADARYFKLDFIAEKSLEKLDEKCEDVIENPRFGDIAPDVMEAILNRTTLVVTEVNLFKALITWKTKYLERTDTNESIEEKMHKVGSFLQKIRYPLMNIDELCQVVFPQNLFKPDDVGRMIAQHKLGLSNLNSIARKGCFGDEYSFSFVLDEAYPRFVFQTDADVFVTRIEVQPYSELCKSLVIYTQPNKSSGYRTYETLVSKSSCNCFFVKRPFLVRKNTLQKVICGESFMEKEHPENKPLFEKRTARAFTVYISEYSRNVEIRVRYPNITTCFEESLCLTMFFRPAPQC